MIEGVGNLDEVIGAVGDVVDDIAVRLSGPINLRSDTDARIARRRGGSAANVAVAAVCAGGAARFMGRVGADEAGDRLLRELVELGVDVAVRRGGRTGSIVVLVDHTGERTMLADRGAATELDDPDDLWVDGLAVLHVPAYSLTVEPLASSARSLAAAAGERGIPVSVDASSVAVLQAHGPDRFVGFVETMRPEVVFCNRDEAALLDVAEGHPLMGAATTVIKNGAEPALILGRDGHAVAVATPEVDGVTDTTGAGDAFAAGFLLASTSGADDVEAARAGHGLAATILRGRGDR